MRSRFPQQWHSITVVHLTTGLLEPFSATLVLTAVKQEDGCVPWMRYFIAHIYRDVCPLARHAPCPYCDTARSEGDHLRATPQSLRHSCPASHKARGIAMTPPPSHDGTAGASGNAGACSAQARGCVVAPSFERESGRVVVVLRVPLVLRSKVACLAREAMQPRRPRGRTEVNGPRVALPALPRACSCSGCGLSLRIQARRQVLPAAAFLTACEAFAVTSRRGSRVWGGRGVSPCEAPRRCGVTRWRLHRQRPACGGCPAGAVRDGKQRGQGTSASKMYFWGSFALLDLLQDSTFPFFKCLSLSSFWWGSVCKTAIAGESDFAVETMHVLK